MQNSAHPKSLLFFSLNLEHLWKKWAHGSKSVQNGVPKKVAEGVSEPLLRLLFPLNDRGRSSQTSQILPGPLPDLPSLHFDAFSMLFSPCFSCPSGTKWHRVESRSENATKKLARVPSMYSTDSPDLFAAEYTTGLNMQEKNSESSALLLLLDFLPHCT